VPELDVRERPVMLDRDPVDAARQGADPVPGVWPPVQRPLPREQRRIYEGMGSELAEGIK
jgi:hypothetical protein